MECPSASLGPSACWIALHLGLACKDEINWKWKWDLMQEGKIARLLQTIDPLHTVSRWSVNNPGVMNDFTSFLTSVVVMFVFQNGRPFLILACFKTSPSPKASLRIHFVILNNSCRFLRCRQVTTTGPKDEKPTFLIDSPSDAENPQTACLPCPTICIFFLLLQRPLILKVTSWSNCTESDKFCQELTRKYWFTRALLC